ncbi:T9SS type A sorting domain-containing protein, partial [Vibrio sp. FNV 38]|nr:T9SS type A sorting domain-containing protein [Vibrio sp. FNV 38]
SLQMTYHISYGTPEIESIAGLALYWDLFGRSIPIHNKVEQLIMDEDGEYYYLDFHYSSTDGLDEPTENPLTVWPNPAKDFVRIEGTEAAEVQVYNAVGQMVKTIQGSNEINVSGLVEGVYLLRITDADGKS